MKGLLRIIIVLALIVTNVHAQSLVPLTAVAGTQALPVCVKEHHPESTLTSDQQTALETIHKKLTAQGNEQVPAERLFEVVTECQEKVEGLPHTAVVCDLHMRIKKAMIDIKQQTHATLVQPLMDHVATLEKRFETLQVPHHVTTYKSYSQLLDCLDNLYNVLAQVQKIDQGWAKPLLDQSAQTLRRSLLELEKAVALYGQKLFKEEYPRRTTDCHALMKVWLDDLDSDGIHRKEQAVVLSEQQIMPSLDRSLKNEALMPVLQRAHKEFVMSPCFHKLKARVEKTPAGTDTCSLATVVVQEGDKGKEMYVGGS